MAADLITTENVSRETLEKLQIYVDLTLKWTKAINLIAASTSDKIWSRHINDSLQLYNLAPANWSTWVDLGSGGGFPGLVVAIMANDQQRITLIESDRRKCLFLNTIRRELGLNVDVINSRIEEVTVKNFDVVSARALANLDVLLEFTEMLLKPDGMALFPKGEKFQTELDQAMASWSFSSVLHHSKTNPSGRILELSGIKKREP